MGPAASPSSLSPLLRREGLHGLPLKQNWGGDSQWRGERER